MTRVVIPAQIWRRLRPYAGYGKALAEFVKCCEEGRHPPRVYKPSGIARDGTRFEPYLRLSLFHHHLSRKGDPLLVTQHIDDFIFGVAVARHSDHIFGDKMLWLQTHIEAIDWGTCEDLHETVRQYRPAEA